ncbi:glutathione ABC transporter substrate-binding protein GsiB [Sutterella sp.]|uniref:glutathione ABC transporter substrate-binding protein GsiB n=1 Tax=Sutterella sp. TaxID=1981025 RepID=UPI0026DECD79|nr:glutathione ABC transporter substrate-binding protein GsiB [Sutterella sp.]MDO5532332.1 glutathione ABC transporter substrate-binding protein GsiB [Sutterella sp.]
MTKFSLRGLALSAAVSAAALAASVPAAGAAELTVAVAANFTTMDPYDANDTLSQSVAKSFYEGLFSLDKDMKLVNVLAESYTVSPDGLEYTMKLKKGVMFHDGTEFQAAAVKANFDRVTNKANALQRYSLYSNIAKTEVIDPYTVKFTLKKPFSAFINQLAHASGGMICPSALEKYPGKQVGFHPCGTGPFTLDKYNPSEIARVVKNPNYRDADKIKLDAITFKPVTENSTRVAMLRTGEAQVIFPVPPEQVKSLESDDSVSITVTPSISERYVAFNVLKKPFDDPRVRKALNYAVNKQALAKVAYSGFAMPAAGVAGPGVDFQIDIGPWPYDPKKARELLKEAGYPNGFETTLWSLYNHTTGQKVIQFLQQQFAQVGVKASIMAMESGQRTALLSVPPEKAGVKMIYTGWSPSTGELDWAMRPLLATESWAPVAGNYGFFSNKKFDDLVQEALATTDREKKQAIYSEAQKIIWDEAPWIFLIVEQNVTGRKKNVENFFVQASGGFEFYSAYLK